MKLHTARSPGGHPIRYARLGQGPPLLFLQGFGVKPRLYRPLLEALGRRYEVIAPDLLRANRFAGQPGAVEGYADLLADFIDQLSLGEVALVGHSLGGAVSFTLADRRPQVRWVCGLNPVLPLSCRPSALIWRSLEKGVRESIGREGLRAILFANRFHPSIVYHSLRDIRTTARIAADVCRFDYEGLDLAAPSTLVYGERDEFFHLSDPIERQLQRACGAIDIERHPTLNHDWPAYRPEVAVAAIERLEVRARASDRRGPAVAPRAGIE